MTAAGRLEGAVSTRSGGNVLETWSMPNTADLAEETAALKAMLIAADARDLRKDERIERLENLVAALKHEAFGRRPEKCDLFPGDRLRSTAMKGLRSSNWHSRIWKLRLPRSMPNRMQRIAPRNVPVLISTQK